MNFLTNALLNWCELCLIVLILAGFTAYSQPNFQNRLQFRQNRIERLNDEINSETTAPAASAQNAQAFSTNNTLDPAFAPNITEGNGAIAAIAKQPDGKIIIGGTFYKISGVSRNGLARLNADGTLDSSFNPMSGASELIDTIAVQPDGKILIGGRFTTYNGISANRIARLNADGSFDATFNFGTGFNSIVSSIAVQSDGKIWVGGSFNNYNGASTSYLVRLNAEGSINFAYPASSYLYPVTSLLIQPDGKLLVGRLSGDFPLERINPDGNFDFNFNASSLAGNSINAIALEPDGKIIAGGFIRNNNGPHSSGVVRLNSNGSLINTFPAPDNVGDITVTSIALLANGKILSAGYVFTASGDLGGSRIYRFNADGSRDNSFNAFSSNDLAASMMVLPNDRILIGGYFTNVNGQNIRRLVRLKSDGTLDAGFTTTVETVGIISDIAPQSDGKIVVAGHFEFVNGVRSPNIARLNSDGSYDATFNVGAGTDGLVDAVAIQPDGKILITGFFGSYNNSSQGSSIFRLNADGTLDNSFVAPFFSMVYAYALALQPDGKILVGGLILSSNASFYRQIVRLNNNGSLDSSFDAPLDPSGIRTARVIALQSDGKILVGGNFTNSTSCQGCFGIIRLNENGSRDTTFTGGVSSGTVHSIAVQPDGKIIAAGFFSNLFSNRKIVRLLPNGAADSTFDVGSDANNVIIGLALQTDGKILIGGNFTSFNGISRNGVARLNSDGTLDSTFDIGSGANKPVNDVVVLRDGKILIGGAFTSFDSTPRTGLARLSGAPQNRKTAFDFDGDGKADVSVFRPENRAWYLNRSTAGFTGQQFGLSTDKLVPADYDGDGRTDIAVFRDGNWYISNSSNNAFRGAQFGSPGDVPVPADYDGDGRADFAVFRQGVWYFLNSTDDQFRAVQFGLPADKPVPADYDGDNKANVAVYRDGFWYWLDSSTNQFKAVQFGTAGDKPVPADYDGDGRADQAVFRQGFWYLNRSTSGFTGIQFGVASDIPTPADYDGDGKTDISVFRGGNWYRLDSSNNSFRALQFGITTDLPVPAAFIN